jgi:hypothetical protein
MKLLYSLEIATILGSNIVVDPSSAMWGYGFGRTEAELEAEEKAKARRRKKYRKVEPALIDLESFEVKDSRAVITVKNVDVRPATIIRVNLWKVLRKPVIKSGLLTERIIFFERVDRETRPNVFTVLPSQVLNVEMSLTETLAEGMDYVLDFYMGSYEEPDLDYPELTRTRELGWAFLITFKDKRFEKVAIMNSGQAKEFWNKVRAEVDELLRRYPRRGKNILMISSLFAILLLGMLFYFYNPLLIFIGFIGWLLVLAGWRKAKNGKSALGHSLAGGLFMILSGICFIPGILAIIGGLMSKRPKSLLS